MLVRQAIETAEASTSAEVKLVILRHCWQKLERKAAELFRKHNLHETEQRNAVLVVLVTTNRECLVHGDEGIHARVGQSFWENALDVMVEQFRQDQMGLGLKLGIELIGQQLKQYFPASENDVNEIDNGVVYEE